MGFIAKEFPHLSRRFDRLYAGAYAPKSYSEGVRSMVAALRKRYMIGERYRSVEEAAAPEPESEPSEQQAQLEF
jgi:hypothetical protein